MSLNHLLKLLLISLLFGSCQTYSDQDKDAFDKKIRYYLKKKKINCTRSDSGLYYKILKPGGGDYIKFQDEVSFTYHGKLIDGTVFDDQKKPVSFEVKELIAAWKEIMLELKPGAKAFLVAPPQLGYGDHQLDDIPQHSILIYDIEIIEVK
jgi:FKBP-type peptidyl-prolyl cis-trans isomerase FkpA